MGFRPYVFLDNTNGGEETFVCLYLSILCAWEKNVGWVLLPPPLSSSCGFVLWEEWKSFSFLSVHSLRPFLLPSLYQISEMLWGTPGPGVRRLWQLLCLYPLLAEYLRSKGKCPTETQPVSISYLLELPVQQGGKDCPCGGKYLNLHSS